MKIIGFDPSLKQTGYAIIEYPDLNILSAGFISTDSKDEFPNRIEHIYDNAFNIIKKYKIEHAAFEESFYNKNVKSANILAQVRAILILAAKKNKCTISLFAPNTIKKAVVGKGHASKEQVAYMIKTIFDIEKELPDDVSDAIAIAYTFITRSY